MSWNDSWEDPPETTLYTTSRILQAERHLGAPNGTRTLPTLRRLKKLGTHLAGTNFWPTVAPLTAYATLSKNADGAEFRHGCSLQIALPRSVSAQLGRTSSESYSNRINEVAKTGFQTYGTWPCDGGEDGVRNPVSYSPRFSALSRRKWLNNSCPTTPAQPCWSKIGNLVCPQLTFYCGG